MAYNKTKWSNGDVVTAAKMNQIESGVEADNDLLYMITATNTDNALVLNKTWQEINNAFLSGKNCLISARIDSDGSISEGLWAVLSTYVETGSYIVFAGEYTYTASDQTGYPELTEG